MASFKHQGKYLAYEIRGEGERPMILLPGLLMNRKMHYPLADRLAAEGNRMILFDPLGHGESDRPQDMWHYSMSIFGEQVIALMDHLGIEQAVVGGPSMGANTTLEAAVLAPDRLRGMLIEMPVLDNAIPAVAAVFTPVIYAFTFGRPIMQVVSTLTKLLPKGTNYFVDIALDYLCQDPGPSGAVMQGLFFGRAAPPRHLRKEIEVPALILGHPRDAVHPFNDAQMLARELPHAKLIEANSVLELRTNPERLARKITDFLDECWKQEPRSKRHIRVVG